MSRNTSTSSKNGFLANDLALSKRLSQDVFADDFATANWNAYMELNHSESNLRLKCAPETVWTVYKA